MEGGLVAIFCSSFPPEGGGASARIYNLAHLLKKNGYRVQVVCAMPNYPTGRIFDAYRGKLVVNEAVDGIAVKRVWLSASNRGALLSRGWSMVSFVFSLRLFAFRAVRRMKPDLIIVSSPPLPMASSVMRHFSKKGFKVMLNVSDIWPLSANALGAMDKSGFYAQLETVARKMYESATAITAQSDETLDHIRSHCVPMPAAMLYRNLPAADVASFKPSVVRAKGVTIIYPGMLGYAQGLISLCQAIDFKSLGAMLHIYGEGPERDALAALAALQPDRGIRLHPPVPPESMMALLATADAMLIPLAAPIEGAVPSKLFTAIQAGIPILYSGGGEGEKIVKTYELGWTAHPGDFAIIAQQIKELSTLSAEDIQQWRARIRETGATHFSKAKQDAQFLRFLSGVMDAV